MQGLRFQRTILDMGQPKFGKLSLQLLHPYLTLFPFLFFPTPATQHTTTMEHVCATKISVCHRLSPSLSQSVCHHRHPLSSSSIHPHPSIISPQRNTMEDCVQLPKLIDIIISFLDHGDQITCLRVNSVWHQQATRQIFQWSIKYLEECSSPQLFRLLTCKGAIEAFKRNLVLARDLKICNSIAIDLVYSSNVLVNLVTLNYRARHYMPDYTEELLGIIQRNLGLRSLIIQPTPCVQGPFDKFVRRFAPILQSLADLTYLEFDGRSYFYLADFKLLIDSLPTKSLKSLRMTVEFKDVYIRHRVGEMMNRESPNNIQYDVDTI